MPRPKKRRHIRFSPGIKYFKPRGVPMNSLQEVLLYPDEIQAIKLYDQEGLQQKECAKKMGISQPTFARIIRDAHKKVGEALINGYAIKISGIKQTND